VAKVVTSKPDRTISLKMVQEVKIIGERQREKKKVTSKGVVKDTSC
jgi:hypothetical protein